MWMILHELMEDCLLMSCLLNDARGMLVGAVVVVVVVVHYSSANSRIEWIILRLYVYVNNLKTNFNDHAGGSIDVVAF